MDQSNKARPRTEQREHRFSWTVTLQGKQHYTLSIVDAWVTTFGGVTYNLETSVLTEINNSELSSLLK